jgi:hypothetical protein
MNRITKETPALVERMSSRPRPLTVDCPDCPNRLSIPRAPGDPAIDDSAIDDSAIDDSAIGDSAMGDPTMGDPTPGDEDRRLRGLEATCGDCGSDLDLYYLG